MNPIIEQVDAMLGGGQGSVANLLRDVRAHIVEITAERDAAVAREADHLDAYAEAQRQISELVARVIELQSQLTASQAQSKAPGDALARRAIYHRPDCIICRSVDRC